MSLSSLIVQREIASIREVEEALARQVLYGGDLVTNLLEVVVVDETILSGVLAESYGMQPAPDRELPLPPPEAKRLVPKDLAVRHSILPLSADRTGIVVAVAEPLTPDVEQELSFALSLPVAQRISPLFRVRQAISKEYDVPLERRYQRLLARIAGRDMPVPNSLPPLLGQPPDVTAPPRPPSEAPRIGSVEAMPAVRRDEPAAPPPPRDTRKSAPPPPAAEEPPREARAPSEPPIPLVRRSSQVPAVTVNRSVVLGEVPPAPALPTGLGAPVPSQILSAPQSPRAASDLPPGSFRRASAPPPRPTRRRRGPLTLEAALAEMDDVDDRDAVLDLFFEFAKQFFEYSVFFLVRNESADGRDAFGSGLSRDRISALTVPLEEPSMIAIVRDKRTPTLMLPATRVDAGLLAELGLEARTPLLLFPLVVRKKTVALLLGDGSDAGVEPDVATDLSKLATAACASFERLIVRRKLAAAGVAAPPDSPARDTDSEAPRTEVTPFVRPISRHPAGQFPRVSEPAPGGERLAGAPPPPVPPPPAIADLKTNTTPAERPQQTPPLPVALEASRASAVPATTPSNANKTDEGWPPVSRSGDLWSQPPGSEIPSTVLERVRRVSDPPPDEPPPPQTAVQVHRPSGPPIPREEPNRDSRNAFSWDDYVPPSSDQRSVPARRPPPANPTQPPLPSVIVDADHDYRQLVDRYLRGDDGAALILLRAGQHAMPAIMSRFPGPIAIDPVRFLEANPPRAQDAGPLLRLIAGQRRVAFPFVIARAEDSDPARRMWAVLLVSELPYPEAIKPTVSRLFDPDPYVRAAARIAARAISEHHAQSIVERIAAIASSQDELMPRRVAAVEALGELREPLAATLLINALADPTREISDAARIALRLLTRHDFGADPRRWFAFWQAHGSRTRIEWLIAAVGEDDLELAALAADELAIVAKRGFGFRRDLSKAERQHVRNELESWWDSDGRLRLSSR